MTLLELINVVTTKSQLIIKVIDGGTMHINALDLYNLIESGEPGAEIGDLEVSGIKPVGNVLNITLIDME